LQASARVRFGALARGLAGALALAGCRTTAPAPPARPVAPPVAVVPAATAAGAAEACREDNPVPTRLVRLAHSELVQHLAGVLGEDVVRGAGAPVFYLQGDHTHAASERVINSVDFGSYRNAARALARRYVRAQPPESVCLDPATTLTCVHGPLKTLMLRLHRDDLPAEVWLPLERAYVQLAAAHGPALALEAVVASTLLSPALLYRTEAVTAAAGRPAAGALSPAEALELASFAVLGRAPEPAERAELARLPAGEIQPYLARVARAWTRRPAFAARAAEFVQEWLGVSHLRDKLVRPALAGAGDGPDDMSGVLIEEFDAFVKDHFLDESGSFARLFTATQTRYHPELERIYAGRFLPPDRIEWDPRERKGVLGLAGLLAAHASENASDPVQRGMLVRLRILCEPMPPPIPNADLGKVGITPRMQTRERFEALAAAPACRSCHTVINPPGYLFESFDQYGRFRRLEKGRPVDDRGGLPAFFGQAPYPGTGPWSGITQLGDWLSEAPQARLCFAKEFSNYFLSARVFDSPDGCGLRRLADRFVQSGRVADLVEDLVRSEVFRRRVEPTGGGGAELTAGARPAP
jgi:hypothetical protein